MTSTGLVSGRSPESSPAMIIPMASSKAATLILQ
jgi:hypothetical protein